MSAQTTNEAAGAVSLRPDQMRQSRVGKRPVALPKGVTITVANGKIDVKGPKGTLSRALTPNVKVKVEGSEVLVNTLRYGSGGPLNGSHDWPALFLSGTTANEM